MHTVSGTLKHGVVINNAVQKTFVVRELSVLDMVEAEKQAQATQIHAFNVEQLCRALVQIGDFKGPFVPSLLHRMKKTDYYTLLNAMSEADDVGEDEQDSTQPS
jgi:phage FluMu protein gp41